MTYQEFEQHLAEDLGWRKKEISELLLLAKETEKEVVLKSVILLLYAHWEGYIKISSKLYMKYVSDKKLKIKDLSENFKAVSIKEYISRCIEHSEKLTLSHEVQFMTKFIKMEEKKFETQIQVENDNEKDIIDTGANLKPSIFKNINTILGVGYKSAVQTREHYINSQLLANRNAIGHGSKFDPTKQTDFSLSPKDVEKLKEVMFVIIDNFQDDLLDYAINEYYLISKSAERESFEISKAAKLEKAFEALESKYKN